MNVATDLKNIIKSEWSEVLLYRNGSTYFVHLIPGGGGGARAMVFLCNQTFFHCQLKCTDNVSSINCNEKK